MDEEERDRRNFQLDIHIAQFFQSFMTSFSSVFFSAFVTILIVSLTTGIEYFKPMVNMYGFFAIFMLIILFLIAFKNIKRIEKKYIPPLESNEVEPISTETSVNLREDESSLKESYSPIKILLNLYMVIAGFASINAVKFLINADSSELRKFYTIPPIDLLAFLSFFLFIIPFYQGAITHLHETYKVGYHGKKHEIMVDFLHLLAEGMVFLAISYSLSDIIFFLSWLLILIGIDSSFIIFVHKLKRKVPQTWIKLNMLTFAFALIMIWLNGIYPNIITGIQGYIILTSFSIVRTIIDYKYAAHFYWT